MTNTSSEVPGLLIVDDELSVRDSLQAWFRKDGYRVEVAEDGQQALQRVQEAEYDLVLLDIRMPGMDGMEVQRRMIEINPKLLIIMLTAFASVESAVEALKRGAFDYITKPVDPDELSHLVKRALEQRRLRSENQHLKSKIQQLNRMDDIIGKSSAMQKVQEMVRNVAVTDSTVLIRGQSGTGKEVIARSIHANSPRRYFTIVPVNCGAIPEHLLESELFGHEKGAFTGAQTRRKGRLEMCDGGTLFLDEIGTISLKMQVDLLRVLETKEFTRVGGNDPIRVDFRVVCATNQNLEKMVEKGEFREDLYYRINVFTINLPPLKERLDDIPLLADFFLKKFKTQMNKQIEEISPEALDQMLRYHWPGNVRELANAIERAMVIGKPPAILPGDLPFRLESGAVNAVDSLADMEKHHIQRILNEMEGNVTRAAERLGIDRVTLYNKIKKYDLTK